jgi:hypothetical protein
MSDPEQIDEDELFEQAVTDDGDGGTPEPELRSDPEPKPEPEAKLEAEGDKPVVDDNAPQVPSWRVREINEEKRRLADENERFKAELAEFRRAQQQPQQQRKEPEKVARPDPLLDPDGYAKQVREDIRTELLNERREESLQKAAEDHPDDFKAAYALAQQRVDPALQARMQQARDPGKTLLSWYREQKTVQEVGNDPKAWFEKQLEERMKDPAFLAKAVELARGQANPSSQQQRNGRPRVELPPTLNGASRANASSRSAQSDLSDDELWSETTA